MRRALRIITGGLAALLLAIGLFFLTARVMPVSLAWLAPPLAKLMAYRLDMKAADLQRPQLYWAHKSAIFALKIDRLTLTGRDASQLSLSDVTIVPSRMAIMEKGLLSPAIIDIARLHITPAENTTELPISTEALLPQAGEGGRATVAQYIALLAIRSMSVGAVDSAFDNEAATQSHFLLSRRNDVLRMTTTLAYQQPSGLSRVDAVGIFTPGQGGNVDVALDNINPRDIGRFSQLLAPLQGIRLPITAQLAVNVDGAGGLKTGQVNVFIAPGDILLADNPMPVQELTLAMDADFAARQLQLTDVRFNVAGVAGSLTGQVDYRQSERGQIADMDVNLAGRGVIVDLPKLFGRRLDVARLDTQFSFDVGRETVLVDRLTAAHNFGETELTGAVVLADANPQFDFKVKFGEMSRTAVNALWPLPIAPRTRTWTEQNLIGGRLSDGSLTLRASLDELVNRKRGTPLREEALRLDLEFADIGIRFLKDAPPLEGTNAKLYLGGTSFSVTTQGGQVWLPSVDGGKSALSFGAGSFRNADFRNTKLASDIRFAADGRIRDVMKTLTAPPFNLPRPFDFDRLSGNASADVFLQIPILAKPGERKVTYAVKGASDALAIDGKLGPYQLSDGRVAVDINNQRLRLTGVAAINGVEADIDWTQPFGEDAADKSVMQLSGLFTPQDFADLGQAWVGERFTGLMETGVAIDGALAQPRQLRISADMQQARFMPRPLAYEKPEGAPGRIEAVVKNNADGQIETISGSLDLAEAGKGDFSLQFDDELLVGMRMSPLSLGGDKDLKISITRDGDNIMASVLASVFDVSGLLDTANSEIEFEPEPFAFLPFLGRDAIMEAQIDQMVGAHDEAMQGVKIRLIRQNALHEKMTFDGVFKDGTSLIAGLDREDTVTRRFAVQAENTGNILRLLDLQKEVYGGSLVVQGNVYDLQRDAKARARSADGRITMVGFRARNVPVLASLFSLASLSGIADTLSGEGIKFRKLQSNFVIHEGKLTIDDGRMHGPAVGLTMQGDYDFSRGAIDVGGTLVPAYTLNSFFGKIPLVGRILASREGEGLVGIGYRISGDDGKASVLVNPLSVLTPGVFRRIFELGIGLPENIDDLIPELPSEELTQ